MRQLDDLVCVYTGSAGPPSSVCESETGCVKLVVRCLEFKAASAVATTDAKDLLALRDDLGERFLAGAVIYSGAHLYEIADRVFAIPLCAVWG